MAALNDLNTEQREAVLAWARAHGRTWKRALRTAWMYSDAGCALQQVRNQYGPSWLDAVKIPTENTAR